MAQRKLSVSQQYSGKTVNETIIEDDDENEISYDSLRDSLKNSKHKDLDSGNEKIQNEAECSDESIDIDALCKEKEIRKLETKIKETDILKKGTRNSSSSQTSEDNQSGKEDETSKPNIGNVNNSRVSFNEDLCFNKQVRRSSITDNSSLQQLRDTHLKNSNILQMQLEYKQHLSTHNKGKNKNIDKEDEEEKEKENYADMIQNFQNDNDEN